MNLLKQINNGEEILVEAQTDKLTALFLNCTLKKSNISSNTKMLIDKIIKLMPSVKTEVVNVVDYQVDFGVSYEKESNKDEWPIIYNKIKEADIVVMCTPIWFGVRSSVLQLVFERMIGSYSDSDEKTGRYPMYGKVGGIVVTGNEDGAHDVIANTMGNMSHLGFLMPPQCDCYWVGDSGAGPSYIEAGQKHLHTNKNIGFMAHNLPFYANLIKRNPNNINLNELTNNAEEISDKLPDYKNHADQKEDAENQKDRKTDRERQENDNS
jgi:multimeric flavodoxin WrbA